MNQKTPFVTWRLQHPAGTLDIKTDTLIHQWVLVSHQLLNLFDQFDDDIKPWLGGRKSPLPDLVGFIAAYGYSRTVTGDWVDLPIDIPEAEVKEWEDSSSVVGSIQQLRDYQAGVAGSVAEVLYTYSKEFVALVNKQLTKLYDELDVLVAKPVADFTPTQWEDDALIQEVVGDEIEDLDRIFDLYEKLWCFEQGIEELRMLMITEDDPEFHLPSQAFYDVLKLINSHKLLEVLDHAEPKLKVVLKLWSNTVMSYSGKPYHRPNDENAPDVFWWRHWEARNPVRRSATNNRKPQAKRRPQQSHRPNTQ